MEGSGKYGTYNEIEMAHAIQCALIGAPATTFNADKSIIGSFFTIDNTMGLTEERQEMRITGSPKRVITKFTR